MSRADPVDGRGRAISPASVLGYVAGAGAVGRRSRCLRATEINWALGTCTADLAAFVSMAPVGEQSARELYTYKHPTVGAVHRQRKTLGLGAVL